MNKDLIIDNCLKIFKLIGNLSENSTQEEQIRDEILDSLEIMQSSVLQFFRSEPAISETEHRNELRMQKINRYIHLHYQDAIQEEEVAREIGMSTRNFCRFFSETPYQSFSKYLNKRRIKISISYLKNTKSSIAEIAYLCGFSSPAYFGKIFKEMLGKTPKMYRAVTNK